MILARRFRGKRIWVLVALAAFAVPSPVAATVGGDAATTSAAAASSASVHLTGTLQVAVTDDFAGGSQTFYSLETESGTVPLAVSGPDAARFEGAEVSLAGTRLADGRVAVAAGSIEPDPRQTAADQLAAILGVAPAASGEPAQPALSTRKIAVIIGGFNDLGSYSDGSAYPVTVEQANQAFTTDPASVHNYFDETSRGELAMDATVVGRWPLGISQCQGGDFQLYYAAVTAAENAAAAHGVNLASYNHVFVWTRAPTGSCEVGWAGVGDLPGSHVLMILDYSAYGWPRSHAEVASHELDHNLGLYHSNGLACWDASDHQEALGDDCSSKEYYDQYSTMGIAGSSVDSLLDADRLDSMGWLDESEKQTVTAAGTYSLVPTYSTSPGVRLLRIPRPDEVIPYFDGGYWTLEIRSTLAGSAFDQYSSYAPALAATTGVTIRQSLDGPGYYGPGNSLLVDNTPTATLPPGVGLNDYWDAPLQPGNTFTDAAGGFTITVDSVTGSGATVTIGDTEAPTAPPSLDATPLPSGSIRLDWTAASDNLALAGYRIYRDASQIDGVDGATLTYTDTSPVPGVTHTYEVKAVDTAGLLGPAATAVAMVPGPPDAPTGVSALPGNGEAMVSWLAPADDGGSPILQYEVVSAPGGYGCSTSGALSCIVTGLGNGTPYTFTVTAANLIGTSPPSAPSAPVTPLAVPGRPTGVKAIPASGQATVGWVAPASEGGAPIDGYTATSSPGGHFCATTGLTCTVTGLTDGVAYTFTVRAHNSIGTGLPSEPSRAVTPGPPLVRYFGTSRFGTAADVSSHTFPADCGCTAYVAYAYNFPDALAGAAAAGTVPGPVLLVGTSGSINSATAAELTRLAPDRIVVLGSTGVISTSVQTALAGYAGSGGVVRYYGTSRFETAADVSSHTFPADCHCTAYVAYAYNFPDALAGAAAAGTVPGPVLLVGTSGAINSATAAELTRLAPDHIVILGSTSVISTSVETALAAYAPPGEVHRYSGAGRFETAAAISANTFDADCGCVAYIAYAYNFPDALAGAAAAGTLQGPVLLVGTSGAINPATAAELTRLKPYRIIVLGSQNVISTDVYDALAAYVPV